MKAKLFRIAATVLALTLAVSTVSCGTAKKTGKKTHSSVSASSKESSSGKSSSEKSSDKSDKQADESASDEATSEESSQSPATSTQTTPPASSAAPGQTKPAQTPQTQTQPQQTQPAPQPTKPSFDHDAYVKAIFNETNAYRAACGVAPLVWDPIANEMAEVRAKELVQNFSHTRPDGRICYTVVNDFPQYHDKYQPYDGSMLAVKQFILNGENVVYCPASRSAVELWKNSPDHAENMRRPEFSHIGIGSYYYNGTVYSVQIFFTENPNFAG